MGHQISCYVGSWLFSHIVWRWVTIKIKPNNSGMRLLKGLFFHLQIKGSGVSYRMLIKYLMHNHKLDFAIRECLKNHAQDVVEKLFPDSFLKIKIKHISGSIFWRFIQCAFSVCQVKGYRNILKFSWRPLGFT